MTRPPASPPIAEIHQFVPSFSPRDAIGNHVVEWRRVLHGIGVASEIFYGDIARGVAVPATPYRRFARRRPTGAPVWLLYHASTESPMVDWLLDRPEAKLVDYHNVTPAELFGPWEPHVGAGLAAARRQIASLAPVTDLGLADSAFNAAELADMGYASTAVVPILMDFDRVHRSVDRTVLDRLAEQRKEGSVWLFVGRIAPHKAQHDLVKAFVAYRRLYDPASRLHLVGTSSSHRYESALRDYVHTLGLDDCVHFAGSVADSELAAYYAGSDVLVCLSDHEGFGVPVVEAMASGVPVVAYATTSVPETVGDGGLLLREKSPAAVAAAVHRVVTDQQLRAALVERGMQRARDFHPARTAAHLVDVVRTLLSR